MQLLCLEDGNSLDGKSKESKKISKLLIIILKPMLATNNQYCIYNDGC